MVIKIMLKNFTLIIISILLIISCETNPPNNLVEVEEYGTLYVTSNVTGAEIFVDDESAGKITPDSILLKIGVYSINLVKDGYFSLPEEVEVEADIVKEVNIELIEQTSQKIVLIEDFSNVSCIPCVESNKILESLKNSYTDEKLVVIKFAANFPSPVDPMYLANTEDANSRMSYYTIFFTPTIIVDGLDRPTSSDSISIKESIDFKLEAQPKFEITVMDSIAVQSMFVKGKVKLLDSSELNFDDLVIHSVVIETLIEYSSPPGSNGETEFHDVMRKMLPDNQGFSISNIENDNEINFNWETQINSGWNKERLKTIVFIQDKNSKEIYQANSTIN